MSKAAFLFIAAFLLLLNVFASGFTLHQQTEFILALSLILLLGIPHGAIDHLLYLQRSSMSTPTFIGYYLVLTGINVALWLSWPIFSYILFLLVSAYHFGQSQFSHYFKEKKPTDGLLYMSWGTAMLSALILFNGQELLQMSRNIADISGFASVNESRALPIILAVSASITLGLFAKAYVKKRLRLDELAMELLITGLLLISFKLFSFLIAFSLYFLTLHAWKVMQEEFDFLRRAHRVGTVRQFIRLLIPLSAMSILGIAMIYGLIALDLLPISYALSFMIVISSITLPHALVMERFYAMKKGKG